MMPTDTDLMRMAIDGGHLRRRRLLDLWRDFWSRNPPSVLPHLGWDTQTMAETFRDYAHRGLQSEQQRRAARPMSDLEARIVAEHIHTATP